MGLPAIISFISGIYMQRNQTWVAVGLVLLVFAGSMGQHFLAVKVAPLHAWFDALPGKWKVIVIGMMPIALIAVAVGVKYIEMVRARSWVSVPGKIVSAKSVQRKVARSLSSANDEDGEMRNFAEIIYAYEVAGRKLRGERLSIGADLGNSEVAEKLKRYKPGMAVTVHYDPRKPENAVIERDLPDGMFKAGAGIVAGLTALLFAVVLGADLAAKILKGQLPNPGNAPIVTALGLFSAAIVLFGFALKRQAAAADGWLQTKGRILASETEAFRAGVERISTPSRTLHRQRVTYGYDVAGVSYSSDQVSMGARTSSSVGAMEQSIVRRYPVGKTVTVYYDPVNPSQAVLERGARLIWLVWVSAALFAVLAVALSGLAG